MAEALCLRCGGAKRNPWRACRRCAFKPAPRSDELIRSIYLSTGRFEDPEEAAAYREELDHVAEAIRAGLAVSYDESELMRLRARAAAFTSIPSSAVWGAVFRLFLPAIAVVGLLLLATRLLRFLRHA